MAASSGIDQKVYVKRLEWTGHAHSSVICTGDFDEWKGSQPLRKENGKWIADVKLPYGEKQVKYKFLVDGTWQHATDQQFVNDDAGNTNNVFTVPEVPADTPAEDSADAQPETIAQTEAENSQATITSADEAERDIPRTIQDLFSNTSSGDILGPGLVPYNMANFGASKSLGLIQHNYPSTYLLQKRGDEEEDSKEVTPTDVQIACEYILTKYKSVHSQAQNRLNIQKELEAEQKEKEKSEKNGAEDKKLLEAEEGEPSTSSSSGVQLEDGKTATTTPTKSKTKTLPPIQVPGISKLYTTIKQSHPNWKFSEKRLRSIIKEGEEAALISNTSNEPKESAFLEADRIIKLSGLMGSGKYNTELIPISRFDSVLQAELDDQWAASNGLPLPSTTSSVPTSTSTSNASPVTAANGDIKENEKPSTSSLNKPKKKKKSPTAPNGTASILDGITEGVEVLANRVASSVSSVTNAVASSSSSSSAALAALTSAPTKRNPTNAVGDVSLKWYGPVKGRGVVTRRKFKQGSVVFREDAFAFAPTKNIQKAINDGTGCSFCGKLFSTKAQSLVVPCVAHDQLSTQGARKTSSSTKKVSASASVAAKNVTKKDKETIGNGQVEEEEANKPKKPTCIAKFCNKLCRERATEMYANLLCPLVNPSFAAFVKWAETADPRAQKMNPSGVFYIMLRLIVAASKPTPEAAEEAVALMRRIESLAAVNERSRRSRELHMLADMQYGPDWITGYRLVMEALQLPDRYYQPARPVSLVYNDQEESESGPRAMEMFPGVTLKRSEYGGVNALPGWYRNLNLPEEMEAKLLGLDNYLVWLGRVALNQEDDGGVYMLHPCMNHDCNPNVTVRRTANIAGVGAREAKPSRIFVLATRDIEEGEEITVMYINTQAHYGMRQTMLKTDYLFECNCATCQSQNAVYNGGSQQAAVTANGDSHAGDKSVGSSTNEDEDEDVIALALKAPPGATVDDHYASRQKVGSNGVHSNGHMNANHDEGDEPETAATTSVKLSAATMKKKKKKAAAKVRQEQEAAEAAAKAHALDPMGFFKNDKPSTPWYEEDDI